MDIGVNTLAGDFDLRAFAERLEVLRRSRQTSEKLGVPRVTRSGLARALGISEARYFRYERGELQPPLDVLAAIRELTGISLDWLIAGMAQGQQPERFTGRKPVTVGDRLKFAREIWAPFVEQCADVMGIEASDWRAFEKNAMELPIELANEFARRFAVTLDYLYRGEMAGLEPELRAKLISNHPELRPQLGASRQGNHAPVFFAEAERTDSAREPAPPQAELPGRSRSVPRKRALRTSTAAASTKRGRSRKARDDDKRGPSDSDC